jgi:hypothetical protein
MIMVCIISPFAVGCLIFVGITNNFDLPFILIGKGLAVLSFVFGLIGMAVGINFFTKEMMLKVGPAAIVTIIGVILNLAGAAIAALSRSN